MKKISAVTVIALVLTNNFLNAQTTYILPKFLIQIYGGYSLPLAQLRGSLPDSNAYLMNKGFHFGAAGKIKMSKKGYIMMVLSTAYQHFGGSQQSKVNNILTETSMNIFTLGVSLEYDFMPVNKINPYAVSDIKANFISGETHINDSTYTLNSTMRWGIGIGGGVEFRLSNTLGMTARLRYNIENLLGQDADTNKILGTTPNRTYDLNDKEFTYRGQRMYVKLISDLQFSIGFSYYLTPKMVKKKK